MFHWRKVMSLTGKIFKLSVMMLYAELFLHYESKLCYKLLLQRFTNRGHLPESCMVQHGEFFDYFKIT